MLPVTPSLIWAKFGQSDSDLEDMGAWPKLLIRRPKMAKHNDIPKTDPSEIEALIQRLKPPNIELRDAQPSRLTRAAGK